MNLTSPNYSQKLLSEIEQLNPWWSTQDYQKKLLTRPDYTLKLLKSGAKEIQILTGARRVGKTFLLLDQINHLLKKKVPPQNIFYLTAELPAIQQSSISELFDLYQFKCKPKKTIYWLIDEIQEIPDWQLHIKYLYDTKRVRFIVTGSSSLILNAQTAKLTGRFQETHIFPLSFAEFLTFRQLKFPTQASLKLTLLEQYLNTGGYPDYVLRGNDTLLVQTIESIMYRDLLSHYGIRNPAALKDLLQLLCDTVGSPVSVINLSKTLKIDPDTIRFYIKYLQDVYLLYPLYKQGRSHKIVKSHVPKQYLNDTGVLRLFSQTIREGQLVENAVFLHLYRKALRTNTELRYGKHNLQEVDFVFGESLMDAKVRPLSNSLSPEITYLVKTIDSNLDLDQISLADFLLS